MYKAIGSDLSDPEVSDSLNLAGVPYSRATVFLTQNRGIPQRSLNPTWYFEEALNQLSITYGQVTNVCGCCSGAIRYQPNSKFPLYPDPASRCDNRVSQPNDFFCNFEHHPAAHSGARPDSR